MATDNGSLLPTKFQRQRRHRPGPMLHVICDDRRGRQPHHPAGPRGSNGQGGHLISLPPHPGPPPEPPPLQAMRWDGKIYIDPMLPFGLRSASKIFNAVADALNWVIAQAGVRTSRHYLDDFIVVGPAGSAECQQALDILTRLCRYLGVPLACHWHPTSRWDPPPA